MKCILFVNDEEQVLDRLRRMVKKQRGQWELYFAPSGTAALNACACLHFDVVVTDLHMPSMDGIALLRAVRELHPESARLLISDKEDLPLATRAASVAYRVLPKGILEEELVSTITDVCILQDSLSTEAMRKVIGRIGALPSLSRTYMALSLAVQDPDSSIDSITAIIEQDVAMAAKVLQIANSGFFSFARRMTKVATAVSYLGIETIKNLVLTAETFSVFVPDPCIPRNFIETLQRRAERAALIAGQLPLNPREREIAIVAALLHDVGELALASRLPSHVRSAMDLAKERSCTSYEAEEMLAGVTHAELGAYLLGVWGIGGQIAEAVAHHHRPQRVIHKGFDSTTGVYLAALIADELERHPEDTEGAALSEPDKENLKALGLANDYPALRARAMQALQMPVVK
jgi:HD-like signal output (HDOD) protein